MLLKFAKMAAARDSRKGQRTLLLLRLLTLPVISAADIWEMVAHNSIAYVHLLHYIWLR